LFLHASPRTGCNRRTGCATSGTGRSSVFGARDPGAKAIEDEDVGRLDTTARERNKTLHSSRDSVTRKLYTAHKVDPVTAAGSGGLFEQAWKNRLPLLIKGPTGCGKTRFVAHMAARLGLPLYTVACHDDLTAADLVGRHLLGDGQTVWCDGPLTRAVREGGICYLDEVVEARKDTTVVIHPLADDRRVLPIERTGELLHAPTASCW
jgi:sigma54-dependent transcription regulator